jgi:hypothetical protein
VPNHNLKNKIPALANDDVVTFLHTKAWGNVSWDIRMPLLIPIIENK